MQVKLFDVFPSFRQPIISVIIIIRAADGRLLRARVFYKYVRSVIILRVVAVVLTHIHTSPGRARNCIFPGVVCRYTYYVLSPPGLGGKRRRSKETTTWRRRYRAAIVAAVLSHTHTNIRRLARSYKYYARTACNYYYRTRPTGNKIRDRTRVVY